MTVKILIRYFDVTDEMLAGEAPVTGLNLVAVRRLLGAPSDDPMYDSYPVSEEQAEALSGYTDLEFDFSHFDYFIECDP